MISPSRAPGAGGLPGTAGLPYAQTTNEQGRLRHHPRGVPWGEHPESDRSALTGSSTKTGIWQLTGSGKALAGQVKQLWCALAEETVTGLPPEMAAGLPAILNTLTGNVDTRRPRRQHGK
jgi:hypothetical protein